MTQVVEHLPRKCDALGSVPKYCKKEEMMESGDVCNVQGPRFNPQH
jgi:hypothetical protein